MEQNKLKYRTRLQTKVVEAYLIMKKTETVRCVYIM